MLNGHSISLKSLLFNIQAFALLNELCGDDVFDYNNSEWWEGRSA